MPEPRRHMAVAFLKTKLLLADGTEQSGADLFSMDVYDIDKGKWTKAPEARESFTNESLMCQNYWILTFYNKGNVMTHTYDPYGNWSYDNYFGASMRNYYEDQWNLFNFGDEYEEDSANEDHDRNDKLENGRDNKKDAEMDNDGDDKDNVDDDGQDDDKVGDDDNEVEEDEFDGEESSDEDMYFNYNVDI